MHWGGNGIGVKIAWEHVNIQCTGKCRKEEKEKYKEREIKYIELSFVADQCW